MIWRHSHSSRLQAQERGPRRNTHQPLASGFQPLNCEESNHGMFKLLALCCSVLACPNTLTPSAGGWSGNRSTPLGGTPRMQGQTQQERSTMEQSPGNLQLGLFEQRIWRWATSAKPYLERPHPAPDRQCWVCQIKQGAQLNSSFKYAIIFKYGSQILQRTCLFLKNYEGAHGKIKWALQLWKKASGLIVSFN